jgi:DNA primase
VDTLGGTGFALLGTALLEEHKRLLAKYKKVVVALDPDAMSKTLVYARELKASGIEAVAMNLLDDLKYRVPEDIAQLKNRMRS